MWASGLSKSVSFCLLRVFFSEHFCRRQFSFFSGIRALSFSDVSWVDRFYYLKLQMAHQNAYLLYVQISYCLLYTEQLYSIFIILSIEKSIRFECFSFMNFYLMYLSLRFQTVRQTLLLIPFVYHTKSRQNLVGLEHLVYYLFYF